MHISSISDVNPDYLIFFRILPLKACLPAVISSGICAGMYQSSCLNHGFLCLQPPMTPTSRNYAEIRDRLRLRLKKKVGTGH